MIEGDIPIIFEDVQIARASNGFEDAQPFGYSLSKSGLPAPQASIEEEDRTGIETSGNILPECSSGFGI
ncbi:MAG: hypothetical protein Kow009_10700 [Spirochaetales bacterium]